jgi:hypothetical protein
MHVRALRVPVEGQEWVCKSRACEAAVTVLIGVAVGGDAGALTRTVVAQGNIAGTSADPLLPTAA